MADSADCPSSMCGLGSMSKPKYYPQTDLHVALMFLETVHNSITLVVDRADYFAYVKREIINVLGVPSWNERDMLRYSDTGKIIRLVSAMGYEYEQRLAGIPECEIYVVEGWNVDDVRHAMYCVCKELEEDVEAGYYHGTDGRMHASVMCNGCGKRVVTIENV